MSETTKPRRRSPPPVTADVAAAAEEASAEALLESSGEDTVTMVFPRDVHLTQDNGARVLFKAGTREVPASLVSHWYLEAHGVKRYAPVAPAP